MKSRMPKLWLMPLVLVAVHCGTKKKNDSPAPQPPPQKVDEKAGNNLPEVAIIDGDKLGSLVSGNQITVRFNITKGDSAKISLQCRVAGESQFSQAQLGPCNGADARSHTIDLASLGAGREPIIIGVLPVLNEDEKSIPGKEQTARIDLGSAPSQDQFQIQGMEQLAGQSSGLITLPIIPQVNGVSRMECSLSNRPIDCSNGSLQIDTARMAGNHVLVIVGLDDRGQQIAQQQVPLCIGAGCGGQSGPVASSTSLPVGPFYNVEMPADWHLLMQAYRDDRERGIVNFKTVVGDPMYPRGQNYCQGGQPFPITWAPGVTFNYCQNQLPEEVYKQIHLFNFGANHLDIATSHTNINDRTKLYERLTVNAFTATNEVQNISGSFDELCREKGQSRYKEHFVRIVTAPLGQYSGNIGRNELVVPLDVCDTSTINHYQGTNFPVFVARLRNARGIFGNPADHFSGIEVVYISQPLDSSITGSATQRETDRSFADRAAARISQLLVQNYNNGQSGYSPGVPRTNTDVFPYGVTPGPQPGQVTPGRPPIYGQPGGGYQGQPRGGYPGPGYPQVGGGYPQGYPQVGGGYPQGGGGYPNQGGYGLPQ